MRVLALLMMMLVASVPATAADASLDLSSRVGDPNVGIEVGRIDRTGHATYFKVAGAKLTFPLNEHTEFEIGSITKTFTATILASMVLDGSVHLSDPVQKFLPANVHVPTSNGKMITLLDLATQHSGLPRMPDNMHPHDDANPYADYSRAQLYAYLNKAHLARDPGAAFEYSNLGAALLGVALANRAGTTYETLLRRRVLDPLGMHETFIAGPAGVTRAYAPGYDSDGHAVKLWTFDVMAPAGALVSTASDMLKYVRCNLGEGPLAEACLYAQQPRATFPGNHIGLIWWHDDLTHIIHHGGDTAGWNAAVAIAPDRSHGVVVLTNGGLPVDDVAMHAIDPTVAVAQQPARVTITPEQIDAYTGTYEFHVGASTLTYVFSRVDGRLMAQLQGQGPAEVFATAKPDHFEYHVVPASLDFTRDAAGKVTEVTLHQNGIDHTAARPGVVVMPVATAAPSWPGVVALDQTTLASYVGTYAAGEVLFTVTSRGDTLMVMLSGQPAAPVYASARDQFFYKVVDAQISFRRDAQGQVTGLVLHQNGQDIPATRRP